MTFKTVSEVQPFSIRILRICAAFSSCGIVPCVIYAISIIGMTISFAGKPSMNAIKITPSSPIKPANGSRKPAHTDKRLSPPILIFAASHIIAPAGAAIAAARPRTKSVRSNTERIITFPICGMR